MHLALPKLERVIDTKKGNKNIIKQFIELDFQLPANNIEIKDDRLLVMDNGKKYCFTHRENGYSSGDTYVLLTSALPTIAKLNAGEIQVRKWLKHPKLKEWSIDEIIA